MKRLAINESKLKRLVSEGEIRGFLEGDKMKFRRVDIENLEVTNSATEEKTAVVDLTEDEKNGNFSDEGLNFEDPEETEPVRNNDQEPGGRPTGCLVLLAALGAGLSGIAAVIIVATN